MLEIYLYTFVSVIVVSIVSLVGIFTLFLKEKFLMRFTHLLVSLAIGALLGDAFIHLIPESFAEFDPRKTGLAIILGMLVFFVFEKGLHWHHSHFATTKELEKEELPLMLPHGDHKHPLATMILISDSAHNFLDGIIIGASYLVSIEVGIATTLAVVLHEIPQEIGDFGILIHAGYTRTRALLMNFISALAAVLGAVIALALHEIAEVAMLWIVPVAAGGFIYIASADLIPELHKIKRLQSSVLQLIMIIVGVTSMFLLALSEV
jgi:zinc and cadmium transporter